MGRLRISQHSIHWQDLAPLLDGPTRVSLSPEAKKAIRDSHKVLKKIISSGQQVYGVNTGFGKLSTVSIGPDDLKQLQLNLVRSHACGVGKPLDLGVTRITMVLKLMTWAKGYSGVRPKLAQLLVGMLNHDILPVIPRQGSVGASGDLAPLAHMARAMIGEGDVHFQDRIMPALLALKEANLEPTILEAKEGLSLINGTQVSTALGIRALSESHKILETADIAGALSAEASLSTRVVFIPKIHKLKKHPGQVASATNVYNLLKGSDIVQSHDDCGRIQDPYCIRCIPHVHGSSREIFSNGEVTINNEVNSISDNPLVFPNGDVMNSGHFHAEPIAQALDTLSIAMAEIGAIAERRVNYFMRGIGDRIPMFGAMNPGLESGFMLAHVTAAALASENKTLSHPASVDSISTSAGQEDFVSMAPWAGRKCLRILANVSIILAIEILVSGNVNHRFHKKISSGNGLIPVMNLLKRHHVLTEKDHALADDIQTINTLIQSRKIVNSVQKRIKLL
ncbi:MAG: histidine ammonia-lyase [Candidatus Marinimicrobia bacterium]|jgi:histidine ammonia-lyase|nr:histidine ammonia-lyase [Candidatus Neomarinimicrobiota bacterium]MBT3676493.1 histidine ammonia-lyase [Candidatus Neomarinimicrobiota bacterium]MBT3763214.1 histidine ammonia-lyase [Candidatus Neomarinimicrobiota bacterium]MBT4067657.1 histidine ammonia-lyase [Candidatus Neomarinimicrobiota bacterium]MBT4270694.1 histidine ammonia-lyase [Candidatus Neomarinimicrobiota bacterium]